jgi:hypothetical protein
MRLSSLLHLALPVILGCASSKSTAPNLGPPATSGTITSKDPRLGYAVERSPGTTGPVQLYFVVDTLTTIQLDAGGVGRALDLAPGTKVAVWPAGPLPDSVPPRVVARHILIYR